MNRTLAAACAAAALTLAGCAATPAAETTATASRTPSPTPTPTASARQFASIIAEYEKGWRDHEASIVECALAGMRTDPLSSAKDLTCSYAAQTAALTASTATKRLRALPTPEPEVKPLVDRTLAALAPLAKIDAVAACKDSKSATCDAAETEVNGAIRPLVSVLDAWKPYL